jgi:hypothetical protein
VTEETVMRETLMRAARLGDDIDDFCVKCKRVMNHSVVSILNSLPAKVRCRTCHSDHDFRNEQPPPPKVDPRKAALFNQVLENVTGLPAPKAEENAPAADEKMVSAAAGPDGEAEASAVKAESPVEAKPKVRKKTKA